jgi:uncharacterized membrane protein YjjP (DUF1212 family)
LKYSRWILLAGILFLSAGGAARWSGLGFAPFLFSTGGLCKISYILLAIKNGRYRPGFEILFLLSGLAFLFCGIASRHYEHLSQYSSQIIAAALLLKTVFVISFIVKVRGNKN